MRASVLLVLLVSAGCSDDDSGHPADMAMMVQKDMVMTTAATCDPVAQDCGAGKKCVGEFGGTMQNPTLTGTCVADGTVAEGQPCTVTMDDTKLLDDCKAGFECDNFGGDDKYVCRKICGADSDCKTAGQRCGDLFGLGDFGECLPTCTPFSTAANNCPPGNDCGESFYSLTSDQNATPGFFICKKTGTGALYSQCTADSDCGAGLWCDVLNNVCAPNCDTSGSHDCPQPAADAGLSASCTSYSDGPNGAGYCGLM